jgi:hypothetical protein
MRMIFSLVGLLVVVAIVMVIARQQLRAVAPQVPAAGGSAAPLSGTPAGPTGAQQKVLQGLDSALQQGAQRASDAQQ